MAIPRHLDVVQPFDRHPPVGTWQGTRGSKIARSLEPHVHVSSMCRVLMATWLNGSHRVQACSSVFYPRRTHILQLSSCSYPITKPNNFALLTCMKLCTSFYLGYLIHYPRYFINQLHLCIFGSTAYIAGEPRTFEWHFCFSSQSPPTSAQCSAHP